MSQHKSLSQQGPVPVVILPLQLESLKKHKRAPSPCKVSALVSYINKEHKESKHEKEHFIINFSIAGSGFAFGLYHNRDCP
jgi:hypothetical protein